MAFQYYVHSEYEFRLQNNTIDPPVAERFCARTDRREVPGSSLGRAGRRSSSEFSMVFSETRLNTG